MRKQLGISKSSSILTLGACGCTKQTQSTCGIAYRQGNWTYDKPLNKGVWGLNFERNYFISQYFFIFAIVLNLKIE